MNPVLPTLLRPSITSTTRLQWVCGPLFGIGGNNTFNPLLLPRPQHRDVFRPFSISSKPFRRRLPQSSQCHPAVTILLPPLPQPPITPNNTSRLLSTTRRASKPPPPTNPPPPLPKQPQPPSSTSSAPPEPEYDPDLGVPLPPLTPIELTTIFGPSTPSSIGNRILHVQHGRRVHGFLDVPDDEFAPLKGVDGMIKARALGWLRERHPVLEEVAVAKREEAERELVERGVRLGLLKEGEGEKGEGGVYGVSALERLRAENERRSRERGAAREREAEERREELRAIKEQALERKVGDKALKEVPAGELAQKKEDNEPEWIKYYRDRAMSIKDTEPPKMSKFQRLFPSTLFLLATLFISYLFATSYTPPTPSTRIFPTIPPAAATILALISANSLVFLFWRVPPAWPLLNRYFISSPGYPYALSLLGNVFSHTDLSHIAMNMVLLWFVGTKLHDEVGRGTFMGIYFSAGTAGSFVSLASAVLRSEFRTCSLGASGGIAGVVAAWCVVNATEHFKLIWVPEDWFPGFSSKDLLAVLVGVEVLGVLSGWKTLDHWAHLGGYFCGWVWGRWLEGGRRREEEEERRKGGGGK